MASYAPNKLISVDASPSRFSNRPKIVSNVAKFDALGIHQTTKISLNTERRVETRRRLLTVTRSSKRDADQPQQQQEQQMGIEKQLLKAGHGPKPVKGQNVTVHCTGFGKDGDLSKKFWSTKDPGQQPFSFKIGLGSVIKGWDEGVLDMQVGEVARLQCSPDYAYGSGGFPAWGIRPNSVLVFEIEVLSAQ